MKKIVAILCFLTLPLELSFAGNALDFTIHQEYTSTRALGMGNAFTAVADDHSAIFYNSAALSRRDEGHLRMFIRAGISQDVLKFQEDLSKVVDTDDTSQVFDFIESHYGDNLYMRVPTIGLLMARPGWGLAIIPADFSTDIGVHRQVGPALNVNSYLDTTIALSFAWDLEFMKILPTDIFSIGFTGKLIHRAQVSEQLQATQLVSNSNLFDEKSIHEGFTMDLDLAVMWDLGVNRQGFWGRLVPKSIGLNLRNAVDAGYPVQGNFFNDKSEEPDKLGRRLDVGVMYDLPNFWVFDPHFSLEMKDMGHEKWNFMKGLHAGAELYWKVFDWWKGNWSLGLNQGYWTAGFGARFAWFQLDIATWGEEVGTSSDPKENRRYIVEMSLDF